MKSEKKITRNVQEVRKSLTKDKLNWKVPMKWDSLKLNKVLSRIIDEPSKWKPLDDKWQDTE